MAMACISPARPTPDLHDVHHAGRDRRASKREGHLSGNRRQVVSSSGSDAHPGLDGAEGMLDRFAPLTHLLRMLVEPTLHCLDNMFMLPSRDQSFLGGRAVTLDQATLTGVCSVAAQNQSFVLSLVK